MVSKHKYDLRSLSKSKGKNLLSVKKNSKSVSKVINNQKKEIQIVNWGK
jgi:hypothetical protein